MCLDAGPFVAGDAEIDAMTNPPAGHDHVVAKDAFLGGANARQGLPRLRVERVGLELHPDAAQGFEGMTQLQVFRLGVDSGPLPGRGHPGAADLHTPVVANGASCVCTRVSRRAWEASSSVIRHGLP